MQLIAEAYDLHPARRRLQPPPRSPRSSPSGTTGELESYLDRDHRRGAAPGRRRDRQAARRRDHGRRPARRARPRGPCRPRSTWAFRCPASPRPCSPGRCRATPSSARSRAGCPVPTRIGDHRRRGPDALIEDIRLALYASKIVAYSQGFDEIRAGAAQYDWSIDLGAVSKIWRGGCIIRAQFLNRIADAYADDPRPAVLLTAPYFVEAPRPGAGALAPRRRTRGGRPASPPRRFASSLAYYDGLRAERLPAALVQGPARLLRRAHLQAHRQGRHLPHAVVGRPQRSHLRLTRTAC